MILNLLKISDEFVAMFRDKTGYPIVEPAHMVCSFQLYLILCQTTHFILKASLFILVVGF